LAQAIAAQADLPQSCPCESSLRRGFRLTMEKVATSVSAASGALALLLAARGGRGRRAWSVLLAAVVSGIAAIAAFRRKKVLRKDILKRDGESDLVLTIAGLREWSKDPGSYANAGSPQVGDPLSIAEMQGFAALFGSIELPQQLGLLVKKGRPFVNMSLRDYQVDAGIDEWCDKASEKPAEPMWPTVDPHHHIFDKKSEHGDPLMPALVHSFSKRCTVYLPWPYEQLAKEMEGNGVVATVFIECGHRYQEGYRSMQNDPFASVEETRAIQQIADRSKAPMGIVAHVVLDQGREVVEKVLKAHREAGRNLIGVRHSLAWVKDIPLAHPGLGGQPEAVSRAEEFREGMEVLAENGLSYDTWLYHYNLPELIDLARACPRTQIICDHVGGPVGQRLAGCSLEAITPEWKKSMQELAACENVVVKLSGLSMPVAGFGFELREVPPSSAEMAAAYAPYFRHCVECFGPRRCIFASNFPVDKASGSFTTHWNAFKLLARDLVPGDEAGQRALFYDNAVRVYRLDREPFDLPSTSAEAEAKKLPSY